MVKLILVEYKESFELFESIAQAFKFCEDLKKEKVKIKCIDLVEANENNIYIEKDKSINYEDNSDLIIKGIFSSVY